MESLSKACFDVVIPCHNGSGTLREALTSVLSQSLRPVRVILVDDGSTDGSAALVRTEFTDIEVIRQVNQGAAGARNTGVRASTAPYIAFLDADDAWEPEHLAALQVAVLRFPGIDMVGSRSARRTASFERGKPVRRRHPQKEPQKVDFFRVAPKARRDGIINMSSVAFHRRVFFERGLSFVHEALFEDIALFCEVAASSDLGLVPSPTVRLRRRSGSITDSVVAHRSRFDCWDWFQAAHVRAASRIADDPSVEQSRRESALSYRNDLLARHWITVAANHHQHCAREVAPLLAGDWSVQAVLFRIVAHLPKGVGWLACIVATSVLRLAGLPTDSIFHPKTVTYGLSKKDRLSPKLSEESP